jgi:hypothetical protein
MRHVHRALAVVALTATLGALPGCTLDGRGHDAHPVAGPTSSRTPFSPTHDLLPERCFDRRADRAVTSADRAVLSPVDVSGTVVVRYEVAAGRLGPRLSGAPDRCDALVWSLVRALYPAAPLSLVSDFVLFEGSDSDSTGGFVAPLDDSQHRWRLGLDIDSDDSYDLVFGLVHELGHLMSLGPSQVDPVVPAGGCDRYETGEGCALPGSYLDGYVQTQWTHLLDEWFAKVDGASDTKREAAAQAFYNRHPGVFVDEYAATDPDEDFAEALAAWSLGNPMVGAGQAARSSWFEAYGAFRDVRSRVAALG